MEHGPRKETGESHRQGSASRLPYAFALLFLGLLVVAAWVGRDRFRPLTVGDRAPNFTAQTLEGEPVELEDYRGKVLLVNVWATWCAPCREEMPSMETLYRELGGEDFEILAVSIDAARGETDAQGRDGASKERLRSFAEQLDLTFPILHQPSGTIQELYQTTGVPESFIIDRNGVIVRKVAGATVWDHGNYREFVQRLLDG